MGLGVEGGVKCLALSLARRVLAGMAHSLAGFAHLGARELAPQRRCHIERE